MTNTTITLTEKWNLLKKAYPEIRIRDAAAYLSVSEAQLLLTQANSETIPLQNNFAALVTQLPTLGKVKILTRNDHAVHIQEGQYPYLAIRHQVGSLHSNYFDLKLIIKDWYFGFAVTHKGLKTLQFFNEFGTAVHKIHLLSSSNWCAYQDIIEQYQLPKQDHYAMMDLVQKAVLEPQHHRPKILEDRTAFNQAWHQLTSPRQFQGLLEQFELSPLQALRLAPKDMAQQIPNSMARKVFHLAIKREETLVILVRNKSCFQRYTGKVTELKSKSEWLAVKGQKFTLYLREINIHESWLVSMPTKSGMTTSLELFDEQGQSIASISGKQSDSLPELNTWRRIWTTINGA